MSYSTDAADQIVRLTLEGTETVIRLTGGGAKHLAVMLYAILKDQNKTRGKIRLTNMLKSGKELRVFSVADRDLKRFCKEAKRYGVLYTVLKNRKAKDGLTDVMVRAEDASKINRIFERFKLATVDMASVRTQIGQDREKRREEPEAETETGRWVSPFKASTPEEKTDPEAAPNGDAREDIPITDQEKMDEFMNAVFGANDPPAAKESEKNPAKGRTSPSRPSAPSSGTRSTTERDVFSGSSPRSSVKGEIENIRKEQKQKAEGREQTRSNKHVAPRKKRRKKEVKTR